MADYIQVSRRFTEFDPTVSAESDDFSFIYSSDYSAPYVWDDLLPSKACVIIAEGQSGKSEEFRQQVLALRAKKWFAFYCPLESLLKLSLVSALEGGSSDDLSRWLASDEDAWFFFDAVDEAKIEGPSSFNHAIAKAVETIGPHIARAHFFVSSRPHAWDASTDHIMLSQRLGLTTSEERRAPSGRDDDVYEDDDFPSTAAATERKGSTTSVGLRVLRLAPLSRSQVRHFASEQEVPDIEEFLRAIARANADVFATRPDDLLGLISIWKAERKIESYTKVVESNIERKLAERNPLHEHVAGLTAERASSGAQQLAAAMTLARKLAILLPAQTSVPEKTDQCVDPRQVLPDWTPAEISELLGRPLFSQAFYGAVRFHHKTSREYLTARWLKGLLHSRKHRRSVDSLLFARPYNVEQAVVRPSLQPVAGWLAQWEDGVREKLERIDPAVLLAWGDSSSLPTDVRARLLTNYAKRYTGRRRTPLDLHIREIQRLADTRLAPTLRELFSGSADNSDLRRLILKLIEEGQIAECKDLARSIAFDSKAPSHMRDYAISALAAAGTREDLKELIELIVEGSASLERRLAATIVECSFPSVLAPDELITLLQKADAPRDSDVSGLRYHLVSAAKRIQSEVDLRKVLSGVESLLSQKPHIDRFCPVSRQYAWLLEFGAVLVACLLEKAPAAAVEVAVLSILRMGQRVDHIREYSGDVRKITADILQQRPGLLREIFWNEVERVKREGDGAPVTTWHDRRLTLHRFLETSLQEYLNDIRNRESAADRQLAMSVVISIAAGHAEGESIVASAREAAKGEAHLLAALEAQIRPRDTTHQERTHQMEMRKLDAEIERKKSKQERNRQEGIAWLKRHTSSLVIGEHAKEGQLLKNIDYLYRELAHQMERRSRWSIREWHLLEKDYGMEVARAYRDYCVEYWRLYDPPSRSDPSIGKNSTPTSVIIGLSGLAIEAAETENWVKTLSPADAQRATRYALWEMNGFPSWFADLAQTWFEELRAVMRSEIEWEFQQEDQSNVDYYLLSRLRHQHSDLRRALRPDAVDLLVNRGTHSPPALAAALSAILSIQDPLPVEFRQAALGGSQTQVSGLKAAWLAALLCIDAPAALPLLNDWILGAPTRNDAEERLILVLVHLWGDKEESFNTEHKSFLGVEPLLGIIKLAHGNTSLGDLGSRYRSGWVSDRDRAVRATDAAFSALTNQPGRGAYSALLELASAGLPGLSRDAMLMAAETRAEMDTELEPWKPADVITFRSSAERIPRSVNDLFELACHRLDDIKLSLEEGDESVASTLQRIDKEPEFRRNISAQLRLISAGFYNVASEEELANGQKTDIRLLHSAVSHGMPIEIKIADKWSAQQLADQLNLQLVGDYMRESPAGIFLLLRRGSVSFHDKQSWKMPRSTKSMNFQELIEWLEEAATSIQKSKANICLRVIGIDLTLRRA